MDIQRPDDDAVVDDEEGGDLELLHEPHGLRRAPARIRLVSAERRVVQQRLAGDIVMRQPLGGVGETVTVELPSGAVRELEIVAVEQVGSDEPLAA